MAVRANFMEEVTLAESQCRDKTFLDKGDRSFHAVKAMPAKAGRHNPHSWMVMLGMAGV